MITEARITQTKNHLLNRYIWWPKEEENSSVQEAKTSKCKRFTHYFKKNLQQILPLHSSTKGAPSGASILLDLPLDVWGVICSHLSCHDKAQFRAVSHSACHFIDTRTSFWIEVERNLIAREFPPCLLDALGGVEAIFRLPSSADPSSPLQITRRIDEAGRFQITFPGANSTLSEQVPGSFRLRRNVGYVDWIFSESPNLPIRFYGDGSDLSVDLEDPIMAAAMRQAQSRLCDRIKLLSKTDI